MNKVWSTALLVAVINLLLMLSIFAGFGLVLVPAVMVIEIILGLVWCFDEDKRKQGQGVLLGIGLSLLVGGSVCTAILMNLSIGGGH